MTLTFDIESATVDDLARDGRLPIDRLITEYPFADIELAVKDMTSAQTIKPVLRF